MQFGQLRCSWQLNLGASTVQATATIDILLPSLEQLRQHLAANQKERRLLRKLVQLRLDKEELDRSRKLLSQGGHALGQ
jgi:hypothetical protein